MKKIISLLLLTILSLSNFSVVLASPNDNLSNFKKTQTFSDQFIDVVKSSWYYDSVKKAYEYAFMNGNSSTTFNPSGNILLSEVMAIAARLNSIYYNGESNFASSTPWYQSYVDYNKKNKIISSYESVNYRFSNKATREEFTYFIAKSLPESVFSEINSVEDNSIIDYQNTSKYSKEVYLLYRAGIIGGSDEKRSFKSTSYITRAEVAAILTRIVDTNSRVKFTLKYNKPSEFYEGYPLKTVTEVSGVPCTYSYPDGNSVNGYISGCKDYAYVTENSILDSYLEYINSNSDFTLYDENVMASTTRSEHSYYYKLPNGKRFAVVEVIDLFLNAYVLHTIFE